jgi:hypothetical protein
LKHWDKATILPFSLTSRGFFIKNSSWQAKHSIPLTTVIVYGDCVKMREDFVSKFGDKRTGCCITATHRLTLPSSPGIFLPKNSVIVVPHPPYYSVSPFEYKI